MSKAMFIKIKKVSEKGIVIRLETNIHTWYICSENNNNFSATIIRDTKNSHKAIADYEKRFTSSIKYYNAIMNIVRNKNIRITEICDNE